jgi:membrane associated rhomboid family serine protease
MMEQKSENGRRPARVRARLSTQITIMGIAVATAWLVELIDVFFLGQRLNALGIRPRQPDGLWGILFMPLLHGGIGHLLANTVPFIVLGWLVMLRRLSDFTAVTLITIVVTGTGLWLFGAGQAIYIGASSLLFGYFGFLTLRGYFERSLFSIAIAILVLVVYGGMIWGVFPQQPGISWEAHLLGFIGGVIGARVLSYPR